MVYMHFSSCTNFQNASKLLLLTEIHIHVCHFCCAGVEPPDVLFNHQGYLLLSSKDDAELMEKDHKTQMYVFNICLYCLNTVYHMPNCTLGYL